MVTLLYFARLREALGTGREAVALPPAINDIQALMQWLRSRGPAWENELAPDGPVRVAVNQEMADVATPVVDGDEVAFFPPVTGG